MNPNDAARKLQRALQLRSDGRLDAAAALCKKLVAAFPTTPDPVHLLGLIRRQQGRIADAEQLLRRSLRHAPGRADYRANLGNLLGAAGRVAEAEQAYRKALEIDPTFRPARLALARLLKDAGCFTAAEEQARTLLSQRADDAQAWVTLGAALRGQAQLDEAEKAYREALKHQPDYGVARHDLGALLADRYRFAEALVCYDAARAAGIDDPLLETNRARALVGEQQHAEATTLLAQTVERYPRACDAHALLAKLRYMQGDDDFAAPLRNALTRHADDVALQCTYATLLRGAGAPQIAAQALGAALETAGPHAALYAELASARQDAGEFEAALDAARHGCRLAPTDSKLPDRVIDALLSLGRAREVLPLIREARERMPYSQWHIACEATAARLLGDPLYEQLYDYERFVQSYTLPTPPGWSDLQQFNQDLLDALGARNRYEVAPLDQSLRHGTQTPVSLLADTEPVIRAYLDAIIEPIECYRAHVGSAAGHPVTERNRGRTHISGAWSVHLRRGGHHVNHIHPEGWLSSAYYVQVPDECRDPGNRAGWIKFGEPRYPVPGADAAHLVQPRPGLLVLFPSYMWHGTTPIAGDEARVTAPFDVVTC